MAKKFNPEQHRDRIRVRRSNGRYTKWTLLEKDRLSELYPDATWAELLAALPRHNQNTITKMANSFGLSRDKAHKQSSYPIIRQLRARRRKLELYQMTVARKIGTHRVRLANWERGEQMPRLRSFFDWIEALGLDLKLVENKRALTSA